MGGDWWKECMRVADYGTFLALHLPARHSTEGEREREKERKKERNIRTASCRSGETGQVELFAQYIARVGVLVKHRTFSGSLR